MADKLFLFLFIGDWGFGFGDMASFLSQCHVYGLLLIGYTSRKEEGGLLIVGNF